jgi:nitrate reductase delta subunit
MSKALRAMAALLSYPDEALIGSLREIKAFVPKEVLALTEQLASTDLYSLQEQYVSLFDRSRALSLHLFEHVHGESRERGQAMVELAQMYELHGMSVAGHELPDYLPAFLEFASLVDEARELLKEIAHILRALGDRLAERGSRYCTVFAALLAAAGEKGLSKARVAPMRAAEDLLALERSWMDPEVTFGGPQPVRLYRKAELAGMT